MKTFMTHRTITGAQRMLGTAWAGEFPVIVRNPDGSYQLFVITTAPGSWYECDWRYVAEKLAERFMVEQLVSMYDVANHQWRAIE